MPDRKASTLSEPRARIAGRCHHDILPAAPDDLLIAHSHGRSDVTLVDEPCFDRPVTLVWRKRTWRCEELSCPVRVFTNHDPDARGAAGVAGDPGRVGGRSTRSAAYTPRSAVSPGRLGTRWNTVWTDSSNSTAASPAASATASITDYACCSSAADLLTHLR